MRLIALALLTSAALATAAADEPSCPIMRTEDLPESEKLKKRGLIKVTVESIVSEDDTPINPDAKYRKPLDVIGYPPSKYIFNLTDRTFESVTQATSGSTTGRWFVEFMAPWCEHCAKLEPHLNILADRVVGEVNVARVDAEAAFLTAKRFQITHYPTLFLFTRGLAYEFRGYRTADVMQAFVEIGADLEGAIGKGFTAAPFVIPPPLGVVDVMIEHGRRFPSKVFVLWEANPGVVTVALAIGCLIGASPALVYLWWGAEDVAHVPTAEEISLARKKALDKRKATETPVQRKMREARAAAE